MSGMLDKLALFVALFLFWWFSVIYTAWKTQAGYVLTNKRLLCHHSLGTPAVRSFPLESLWRFHHCPENGRCRLTFMLNQLEADEAFGRSGAIKSIVEGVARFRAVCAGVAVPSISRVSGGLKELGKKNKEEVQDAAEDGYQRTLVLKIMDPEKVAEKVLPIINNAREAAKEEGKVQKRFGLGDEEDLPVGKQEQPVSAPPSSAPQPPPSLPQPTTPAPAPAPPAPLAPPAPQLSTFPADWDPFNAAPPAAAAPVAVAREAELQGLVPSGGITQDLDGIDD